MTIAVQNPSPAVTATPDKDWWRGAVIYQIYPRSYQDTSGDGTGDLRGITLRLPYIASLGVDAIWISPFFTSPMKDFGYDVSNYRGVDPMFGSMEDFDMMVAEAHRLGLKVMIDLVLSHTSDQHPWFIESRSSRNNPKADWYVWSDAKPDGTPPNNWLSIFGGSAWEWDTTRRQYFLHNFLTSQPDLNFHNPDVQDALLSVTEFWLERGVDGFRLDTINFYVHDKELRDNPALPEDKRNATIAPDVNPYNYQEHLYSKNRPENLAFLEKFRALLDRYPAAAAVGEVGDAQRGLEIVGEYTSGGKRVHMCYSFDFLSPTPLSPQRVRSVLEDFSRVATDGWSCWAFSNHDVTRHASRWPSSGFEQEELRLYLGLIGALRGSVCLYQGEELGLPEAEIAFEDLRDPYGIRFWPKYKGRDGCRTPMVWEHDAPNAGFTTGRPWLPVPPEHRERAVDVQDHRQGSLLNQYRQFLQFRKLHRALVKGDIRFLRADDSVLAFVREGGNEKVLCIYNFTKEPLSVDLPDVTVLEDLHGSGFSGVRHGKTFDLNRFDAYFGRIG